MPQCVTLGEAAPVERLRWLAEAEQIFFETAYTKTFESETDKSIFFRRWFGNYAEAEPESFLFVLGDNGDVLGYLAGCADSFAASSQAITAHIDYFTPSFCAELKDYPSHFHINVQPGAQGRGLGHILTEQFLRLCEDAGSRGVHIATGAASRAVKFYESCGFRRLESLRAANPGLAVMVRSLRSNPHALGLRN